MLDETIKFGDGEATQNAFGAHATDVDVAVVVKSNLKTRQLIDLECADGRSTF